MAKYGSQLTTQELEVTGTSLQVELTNGYCIGECGVR